MCRQVAKMLAGSLFSRAFSPRSRRLLYRHPPLSWASSPRSDRGRPPSYARAHSPAPLVLSPGIYNTLCFPSAICLGFSAPSLTLLSRVLFLFNSAVSFRIPSSRHPRYLSPRALTSERLVEFGRFFVSESPEEHPDPRNRDAAFSCLAKVCVYWYCDYIFAIKRDEFCWYITKLEHVVLKWSVIKRFQRCLNTNCCALKYHNVV